MKFLKWILTTLGTMILGMSGGQSKLGGKATRRFGIPVFAFMGALKDGFDWKDCSFLLLIPLLATGYGESSFLMGLVGSEWLVRILYGSLLSLPFFFYGWRRGAFAGVLLGIAFSIHAGSLGSVSWFGDFLLEDMIRYGTLGLLIAFNLFVPKK